MFEVMFLKNTLYRWVCIKNSELKILFFALCYLFFINILNYIIVFVILCMNYIRRSNLTLPTWPLQFKTSRVITTNFWKCNEYSVSFEIYILIKSSQLINLLPSATALNWFFPEIMFLERIGRTFYKLFVLVGYCSLVIVIDLQIACDDFN